MKHVIRDLNSKGDSVIAEWNPADTSEESKAAIQEAERIFNSARASGSVLFEAVPGEKPVGPVRDNFNPQVKEYQVHSPFVGG